MIGYDQVDDKWSLSKGLYETCRHDKKLNNTPIVKKRQAGASEKSFCYLPLLRDLLHKIILETIWHIISHNWFCLQIQWDF